MGAVCRAFQVVAGSAPIQLPLALSSTDLVAKEAFDAQVEPTDVSAIAAVGVVGKAMTAYVLASALLEKFAQRLEPRLYLWIALMVVVPRLAFLTHSPGRNIYGNAPGLIAIAENLAGGLGYLNENGKPDGYFEPGYPLIIALCKVAPGDDAMTLKLAQIGFDVVTALAIVAIMARVFTTGGVLLFAALFALHPVFLHLTNNIDQEPLFTLLLTLSAATLYRALQAPTYRAFALAGLVIGLATLTKASATFLPLGAPVALWWLERTRRRATLMHWAVYLLLYVSALAPWAYRHLLVFGHISLGARSMAQEVWRGSDPRIFAATGIPAQLAASKVSEQEMAAKGIVGPPHYDQFEVEKWRLRMAFENYRELLRRPATLLCVLGWKAMRTLYATEGRPQVHGLLAAMQLPLFVLALVGWLRLRGQTGTQTLASLVAAYVGYFYAAVVASMPMLRFFAPAIPLMLVATVAGLSARFIRTPGEAPGRCGDSATPGGPVRANQVA